MENVERFIVRPSIKLFGGVKVTKETEFVTENTDKTVKQTFKNLILTTHLKKEFNDQYKTKEESELTVAVPEGTILLWREDSGYIIPNYEMVSVDEAIESLEQLRGCIE